MTMTTGKGHGLINPAAQTGFASAAAYDKNRPSYSNVVVDQLLGEVLLLERKEKKKTTEGNDDDEGRDAPSGGGDEAKNTPPQPQPQPQPQQAQPAVPIVVDLAAGTGKFTELLAARPEKLQVIAVEPHDGMREQLEKKQLKDVTVVKGTAEDLTGIQDNSVAAVIAAQAFHWFANKNALEEIHRVLRPAGGLGMVWNVEDYNSPRSWKIHEGWETVMRDVIWSFDDSQPRFRHEKWKQVFESQGSSNNSNSGDGQPLFSFPLGEGMEEFETWLSKEDIWNRLRTLSQLAILEGEELSRVRGIFDQAINSDQTVTDGQGRVAIHGRTYFAWTRSTPIPSQCATTTTTTTSSSSSSL